MPETRELSSGVSVEIKPGCVKVFLGEVICRCPGRVFRHSGLNFLVCATSSKRLFMGYLCRTHTALESKGRTLDLREGGLLKRLDLNLVKGNVHFLECISILHWGGGAGTYI